MKKSLLGLLTIVVLFTMTGCGSRKLKSDSDLKEYLNRNYPGEQFEVVSKEEIEIAGDVGGCDSPGKGMSYQVKSLDTNTTFNVKDDYNFNSFFCEYRVESDYLEIAEKNFLAENSVYKVDSYYYCYKCVGLKFEKEKYFSKDEMKQSVLIVIDKLKNSYPFKHENVRSRIDISIDSEDKINDPLNIDDLDENKINQLVENLYQ